MTYEDQFPTPFSHADESMPVPSRAVDVNARLAAMELKIDALDAKLTSVLASVDEIIEQAKPAFEQLMASPMLAMLTGGKKK